MKEKPKYFYTSIVWKDEKEKQKMQKLADNEGRSLSDYCRRKLLGLN